MVWTKTGNFSTSGDYSNALNWDLISLRTAAFSWTVSGSGTNEYYVRTAANGNPGFVATPPTSNGVYIAGSAATEGTLGALTAGQWGYGDNDTLGYSTVYVRLSGGGDPDAQAADHVQFRQIPQATENVRIPANCGDITTSSAFDQSAVAIEDFIIEAGYTGTIGVAPTSGSPAAYLRIDPNKLEDHGSGQVFLDIGSANITCVINNGAAVDDGEYGVSLRGTNIALIDYRTGILGVAPRPGELSTVTLLIGAPDATGSITFGKGVTSSGVTLHGGILYSHCTLAALTNYAGIVHLLEASTGGTISQWGGEFHWGSTGNITTFNLRGGLLNELAGNATRTLSTVNKYRGSWSLMRNKEAVTHTTITDQDSYTQSGGG